MRVKTRRKRGAQRGNQNARRHGFYSNSLNIAETCRFWNLINLSSLEPAIALLIVKSHSLVHAAPDNRRALKEAVKLLAKWYSARHRLGNKDSRHLKKFVSGLIEKGASQFASSVVPDVPEKATDKTNRTCFDLSLRNRVFSTPEKLSSGSKKHELLQNELPLGKGPFLPLDVRAPR